MLNLALPEKLRQFRQDATDRQLKRDIEDVLSDIKRFPKILNYEVTGKVITGMLRSEGKKHRFKLDYSRSEPEFTIDPDDRSEFQ